VQQSTWVSQMCFRLRKMDIPCRQSFSERHAWRDGRPMDNDAYTEASSVHAFPVLDISLRTGLA
jgi:hypothetical protein